MKGVRSHVIKDNREQLKNERAI